MRVFVVERDYGHDGNQFNHVYASLDEAKNYCESSHYWEEFFVIEYDMDTHTEIEYHRFTGKKLERTN